MILDICQGTERRKTKTLDGKFYDAIENLVDYKYTSRKGKRKECGKTKRIMKIMKTQVLM